MVRNIEKNHRISTDGGVGRDLRDGTPKLFSAYPIHQDIE